MEGPRNGSGGFLILWSPAGLTSREAFVAVIPDAIYDFWQGDHKIAQLEMIMIAYALLTRPNEFRGRHGVWMLDNVARCR